MRRGNRCGEYIPRESRCLDRIDAEREHLPRESRCLERKDALRE